MFVLLFVACFSLTALYLSRFKTLQREMRRKVPAYWNSPDAPGSSSLTDASRLLLNLYSGRLWVAATRANLGMLLLSVRILFIGCTIGNLALIAFYVRISSH